MSRQKGGWESIIGEPLHQDPEPEDRTDPQISLPENFPAEVPAAPSSRAPQPSSAGRLQTTPRAQKPRLTLPGAPAKSSSASTSTPAAPDLGFHSSELLEKMDEAPASSRSGPGGPPKALKEDKKAHQELIITAVAGIGILLAVVVYKWAGSETPPPPVEAVLTPPKPKAPVKPVKPKAPPVQQPQAESEPDKPAQAAVPMVSILSSPPGAMVELDGVIYGKTPLILPAQKGKQVLHLKLRKDDYLPYEGTVRAGESGHFSTSIKLRKRRP